MFHGDSPQGLGQIVAQLLAQLGQMPVVQHEADVVFDDSQSFAGTIGCGIQDAEHAVFCGSTRDVGVAPWSCRPRHKCPGLTPCPRPSFRPTSVQRANLLLQRVGIEPPLAEPEPKLRDRRPPAPRGCVRWPTPAAAAAWPAAVGPVAARVPPLSRTVFFHPVAAGDRSA